MAIDDLDSIAEDIYILDDASCHAPEQDYGGPLSSPEITRFCNKKRLGWYNHPSPRITYHDRPDLWAVRRIVGVRCDVDADTDRDQCQRRDYQTTACEGAVALDGCAGTLGQRRRDGSRRCRGEHRHSDERECRHGRVDSFRLHARIPFGLGFVSPNAIQARLFTALVYKYYQYSFEGSIIAICEIRVLNAQLDLFARRGRFYTLICR